MDVAGRIALITGGGDGIGKALALRLLRGGARVVRESDAQDILFPFLDEFPFGILNIRKGQKSLLPDEEYQAARQADFLRQSGRGRVKISDEEMGRINMRLHHVHPK